jgi:hypothetical protein
MPDAASYPDINNIYDMAYAMQEQLIALPSREQRIKSAYLALRTIDEIFNEMAEQQRSLALHAGTVLQAADSTGAEFVYDIGIRGLLDEIDYVELPGIPLGLSLVINTHETFTPQDPTSFEPAQVRLRAPITGIQYIESAA